MKHPAVYAVGMGIASAQGALAAVAAADGVLLRLTLYRRLRAAGLDMVLGREEACEYVSRTTPEK
jgi:hypothetical protein